MRSPSLQRQRRFGELLAELAADLGRVPLAELDTQIDRGLERVVAWFDVDRASLTEASLDGRSVRPTNSWARPGFEPYESDDVPARLPVSLARFLQGESIRFDDPAELPEDLGDMRQWAEAEGIRSHVTTPIRVGTTVAGGVHVASMRRMHRWSDLDLRQLETLAHVFAAAVERRRSERAAQRSRETTVAVLDSLEDLVVVVDDAGRIVTGNPAWRRAVGLTLAEGRPYRQLCEEVDGPGAPGDGALLEGVEQVLSREVSRFEREYSLGRGADRTWHRMTVVPLQPAADAAVVSHSDITGLRRAMNEVERLKNRLARENLVLREEIQAAHDFNEIVGNSAPLRAALGLVSRVAPTATNVLLLGETGTGKELLARAIHARSPRADSLLATVNCPALSPSLIESELFGHERGAFTGADRRKLGRFEVADGGSIFLDEIGELSLDVQAKLLRVLQEGEFQRVGDTRTRRVDVRLIAATNRDLRQAVREGSFREDLYYRLAVFPITLPALRQRSDDVPLLVWHFVDRYARQIGRNIESVPSETMAALQSYDWPGNVRELENVIERAVVLSPGPELQVNLAELGRSAPSGSGSPRIDDVMRDHILRVLEECGGRISGEGNAADRLDIHPNTLRSRMQKLGIQRRSR